MITWTSPRPAAVPPAPATEGSNTPDYYVPIPRRLAEDLRDTPAAVGAFALLARIFRATRQPVPLSPNDLQVFDPALSYGAATRALQRLAGASWMIPQRRPGHKTTYTPSWGTVNGAICAWDLQAPCLGRPRHILALRLDQRLLDVCMGRLDPHPTHPAMARRYITAPLIGLREVGAYALTLAGMPVGSPALEDLRLILNGRAMPVPDEATILAVASQRAPHALSPDGWRRTPFDVAPTPTEAESGQALFFVPPGQIGSMIGGEIADPITGSALPEVHSTASGQRETPVSENVPGSHGIMNQKEINSTTSTAARIDQIGGGGDSPLRDRTSDQSVSPQADAPAPTESARLLQAVGVRHSVAASLADRPSAQVARVIAQARTRPNVRDLAAWVVSALRDLPTAEEPQEPERPLSAYPIHIHPGLSDEQRDRWIRRFRAVTTPAEQRAILEQMNREHPVATQ
jgi:hypothetical protein